MRDSSQYRELAEWIHKESTDFYNSFKWVKDLTDGQMAVHKASQLLNVDCHNGYAAGIMQKMAQQKEFRLQHRAYTQIKDNVRTDDDNNENSFDKLPEGLLLRRLVGSGLRRMSDHHRPIGRDNVYLRGTLFYSDSDYSSKHLSNVCKGDFAGFDFEHPWCWAVPTVEEILIVFKFCKQAVLEELVKRHKNAKGDTPVKSDGGGTPPTKPLAERVDEIIDGMTTQTPDYKTIRYASMYGLQKNYSSSTEVVS